MKTGIDASSPAARTQPSVAVRTVLLTAVLTGWFAAPAAALQKPTARELGVVSGVLPTGASNGIVDVAGVLVGHSTVALGNHNTGVTVVVPHAGNMYRQRVHAAIVVGNGFGKLIGYTQVEELGELESPIALTCTLCVHRVADALVTHMLELPGNESVRSINVVVGETNDGFLNDIRNRGVTAANVEEALARASSEPVEQGSVGAGRGTVAFGWKGGIGTASRVVPDEVGGWTVGVLVQTNFGGVLSIAGVPVGQELGRYYMSGMLEPSDAPTDSADGSVMVVVATDAPLGHRNLARVARRALAGIARTGSAITNGSGDYVIAFSAAAMADSTGPGLLPNSALSPLFLATIEATEEAIYNSLFTATDVSGFRGEIKALPIDSTLAIMRRYGRLVR